MKSSILTFLLLLFLPIFILAESNDSINRKNLIIRAYRTSEAIKIDAVLSENIWNTQAAVSDFVQHNVLEGNKATDQTINFIAYDDEALYIAAIFFNSIPDFIFFFFFFLFWNQHTHKFFLILNTISISGYYFGVSSAGTQYDGVLYNDQLG